MPRGIYKRTKKMNKKISEALKGKRRSEETKKKISESHKGKKHSIETRIKLSEKLKGNIRTKGYKHTEEAKKKISKNNVHYWLGKHLLEETKKKISEINKGKKLSEETKRKMSIAHKGEKSYLWKGGITSENEKARKSLEYKLWRKANMERDNFTCQKCLTIGGKLQVHHINNFADFEELRTAISNGITFCRDCHKEFHKKYGRKNNIKEQINNFFSTLKT